MINYLVKKLRIRGIIKFLSNQKQVINVIKSYWHFLENTDKSAWGSITLEEEKGIVYAVEIANKYEGAIIEVGALFGHTTNLIATLKAINTPLITIDNFSWNPFHLPKEIHLQILERTIRYPLDHCATQIFNGDAEVFYSQNKDLKTSMIFIDAKHDYESVKMDIEWAVSVDCIVISGHDYSREYPGVMKAVDEFFGERVSVFGTLWVALNISDI